MIDFIVENYQFIALVVAALVDVILLVVAVCRKKVNPSIDDVIGYFPHLIRVAEDKIGAGKGEEKKAYVMSCACEMYKHLTGVTVCEGSFIYKSFARAIENILATPQKKGLL